MENQPRHESVACKLTTIGAFIATTLVAGIASAQIAAIDTARWDGYLDYAYVYASADADALRTRIDDYGREAGMTLDEYVTVVSTDVRAKPEAVDDALRRRLAIANLLQYLATREPQALDRSVELINEFEEQQGRHQNLYWYHYIHSNRALEKGSGSEFTRHTLQLWLQVVVPLESPYETLQALSLSQSANSGFVSALPYVYENVARIVLIRSQEMGIRRDLDPLSAIVRMLDQGRVGAHPDVIPYEASSKQYLDRIIARLDGPESDAGSLTFTLVLFEAGKYHDHARSLLASEGLSKATIEAIGVSSGAYQTALNLAHTLQGQSAVYARVLRQLGEVWAAKQRLGVDPYVEAPFTIDGAMRVWRELYSVHAEGEWKQVGFRNTGYESYVLSMQTLWQEIQESSLNAADYYLTRSIADPARSDEHIRSAARTYLRYLAFFEQHSTEQAAEFVPDAAYFAAYEAAKGYGDAFLAYAGGQTTATEVDTAVERYLMALGIFPFDRHLWPGYASALERQGRANQYLAKVRPIAESVARSRHVDAWIQAGEPGGQELAIMRRAVSDELAVMYLGFADDAQVNELEASLDDLQARRAEIERRILQLSGKLPADDPAPASIADDAGERESVVERAERHRKIEAAKLLLDKLDKQLEARKRALPLYQETLQTDGLIDELRAQRDHPAHTLLRRFYYEKR
jgi:hypothetical protein